MEKVCKQPRVMCPGFLLLRMGKMGADGGNPRDFLMKNSVVSEEKRDIISDVIIIGVTDT